MPDEFDELRNLLVGTMKEAVLAAEMAAAEVYKRAAIAAAPRSSGKLAASIDVIRGRTRGALYEGQQRLFVGPEKKKGYYGYFLEKGYTSVGSRRRKRAATATTHSQSGMSGGTKIPGKPWFDPAIQAADGQATQAAEEAFNSKLRELDK